jgi:hypothetical protein
LATVKFEVILHHVLGAAFQLVSNYLRTLARIAMLQEQPDKLDNNQLADAVSPTERILTLLLPTPAPPITLNGKVRYAWQY